MSVPAISAEFRAVFDGWPAPVRRRAHAVRERCDAVAGERALGPVAEAFKWGQPSFANGRYGTSLRLGYVADAARPLRLYVLCATKVVETCRRRFDRLVYDGRRAICPSATEPDWDEGCLRHAIGLAQSYYVKVPETLG